MLPLFLCILLSPAAAALPAANASSLAGMPIPPLPGVDVLGQGIDLLTSTPWSLGRSAGAVLKLDWGKTIGSARGAYTIPHGINAAFTVDCGLSAATISGRTMELYQKKSARSVDVDKGVKRYVGAYSRDQLSARRALAKAEGVSWLVESRAKCRVMQASVLPGTLELEPTFVKAAASLPLQYSSQTKHHFVEFLKVWNTHVLTQCQLGGMALHRRTWRQHLRIGPVVPNDASDMLEASVNEDFLAHLQDPGLMVKPLKVAWKDDVQFEGIHTSDIELYGGGQSVFQGWSQWAISLQTYDNPACFDWAAVSIAEVMTSPWTSNQLLNARAPAVKQAIEEHYNRPGCMNVLFPNYDAKALVGDGSCAPKVLSLRVTAFIDYEDHLYISGVGRHYHWSHPSNDGHQEPGQGQDIGEDTTDYPVILEYTMEGGATHTVEWRPQNNPIFVAPYALDFHRAPTFTKNLGRDLVQMATPQADWDNNFLVSIYFRDQPDGAGWYDFQLTWDTDKNAQQPLILMM